MLSGNVTLPDAVEILERGLILRALALCEGNQCAASKRLGIHRNTLLRKMTEYGVANRRSRARRKPLSREGRPRKRKTGAA